MKYPHFAVWAILVICASDSSFGQSVGAVPADLSDPVRVYALGRDVTAPELLPRVTGVFNNDDCKANIEGKVVLFLIVDSQGEPRNVYFLHPAGTQIDEQALLIAGGDRFKPGVRDGGPVDVAISLELNLHSCLKLTALPEGKAKVSVQLIAPPEQRVMRAPSAPVEVLLTSGSGVSEPPPDPASLPRVGGGVTAPVPIITPVAEFSEEARRSRKQGECMLTVIVDRNGMTRNPKVVRPLGMGLDEKAIEAVRRYRFTPAMRNGEPVIALITIAVNFRL
jgi:TonB family protein